MSDDRLKAEQLREIIEVSALISSSLDPREIRHRAVEAATRLVDAERASLIRIDRRRNRLYFEVALGDESDQLSRIRMVPGQGIVGSVVESRIPAIVNDVKSDERYFPGLDAETGFDTRSMICAPLLFKGRALGALEVINKRSGAFDSDDLAVTVALANQIAIAIENARLHERVRHGLVEAALYTGVFALTFVAVGAWLISLGP